MEAHPVDIHVGKKLRSRRTLLGRSQDEIGTAVGITFQQIQKYERGLNRIGSSRLYEFSRLLDVSISYFFEGFDNNTASPGKFSLAEDAAAPFEHETVDNKEILALVRAYYSISSVQVRKKMLSLIKSLSDTKESDVDVNSVSAIEIEKKLAKVK